MSFFPDENALGSVDLLVLDQEVFSLIYMFLTLNSKITHLKINFATFAH